MHSVWEARRRRNSRDWLSSCCPQEHTSQVGLLLLPWVYKERFHGHGVVFRELQENCSDLTYRL